MPRRRSVTTMERDAEALALHHGGCTYPEIARRLGWKNKASAYEAVRRAIADGYRLGAEERRQVEDARLDYLTRVFDHVVNTEHYASSASGNVVLHPVTGEPLIDDGPVVQAGLALLRVSESRRKLLGLDAPKQVEVRTIDAIDARLIDLAGEVGRVGSARPARVPREA
jgi:hypothetical protein